MSELFCYFENEPEFKSAKRRYPKEYEKEKILYDTTNIDQVLPEYAIEFYCSDEEGIIIHFHKRNVLDLFSIIESCIKPIEVVYNDESGISFSKLTYSDSCDPINKYEFSNDQIEYIREKRKLVLCNKLIIGLISEYNFITEKQLSEQILKSDMDCEQMLLSAIYCKNIDKFFTKNKNSFMLSLLKICKTFNKHLLLYAAEEDLDYIVFNEMRKKFDNTNISHLFNEKGYTIFHIINQNPTENNKKYDLSNIKEIAPLLFSAVLTKELIFKERYNVIKKLITNGTDINMPFKEHTVVKMLIGLYNEDKLSEEFLKIIELLILNGAIIK